MFRLPRTPAGPTVLSLSAQGRMPAKAKRRERFEVLEQHLYDRMLHNDALGEDAASRAVQLMYAIALPGVLVALFLFPAYHQPVERARTMWAQTADHLFYVTYSLVVMGMALIAQWEMLFPDLLDAQVLLSLPIRRSMLLLARVAALGAFLLLAHVGTSGLGALFFPGVADAPAGFTRHLVAHAIAVTMCGFATVLALVALQSLLVCVPGRGLSESVSAVVRSGVVVLLLTVLFLFPLTAHALPALVGSGSLVGRLFPPFWFLGIYEVALYGSRALPIFHELARAGAVATVLIAAAAAALYPAAHALRLKRLVEGPALRRGAAQPFRRAWRRGLHVLVRTPGERATFHFTAQTLWRLPRLQLSLAMYAGVGLALLLSTLLTLAVHNGHVHLLLAQDGVRLAVPVLAFWTVAGLRAAMASPVARQGSWLFDVTGATSRKDELHGAALLVRVVAMVVAAGAIALLCPLAQGISHAALPWVAQIVLALGLSTLLCDLFFLPVRTLPFLRARPAVTRELPLTLVRYFVVFPAFALYVAGAEPWIESSSARLGLVAAGSVVAHLLLRHARAVLHRRSDMPEDLIFSGLGLRD